jgi:hypothetical protein
MEREIALVAAYCIDMFLFIYTSLDLDIQEVKGFSCSLSSYLN